MPFFLSRLLYSKLPTPCISRSVSVKRSVSVFSFNCQSIKKHARDLRGNIFRSSNILMLSETWLENGKQVHIDNFDCIVQYKRPGIRAGGVGIYKNNDKLHNAVTKNSYIYTRNAEFVSTNVSSVGDLCAVECSLRNGKKVLMVSIYISPGKSITEIKRFIHHVLLAYTEGGSRLLNENYHELPMIVTGDFNVNFASKESLELLKFFKEVFDLDIVNDINVGTTRQGTTIDAVFARLINNLSANVYISHFSYHKPIISILGNNHCESDPENFAMSCE